MRGDGRQLGAAADCGFKADSRGAWWVMEVGYRGQQWSRGGGGEGDGRPGSIRGEGSQ